MDNISFLTLEAAFLKVKKWQLSPFSTEPFNFSLTVQFYPCMHGDAYIQEFPSLYKNGRTLVMKGKVYGWLTVYYFHVQVLVVGGGDGGGLREIAKHSCVKEIHLCEIDEVGQRLSQKHTIC